MDDDKKTSQDVARPEDNYDPFQVVGAAAVAAGGGGVLGSFLKYAQGEWSTGGRNMMGAKLVWIAGQSQTGWICWEDRQPIDKTNMGFIAERYRPPLRKDLKPGLDERDWPTDEDGKPVDPWVSVIQFVFADPNSKELFTVDLMSKGGRREAGALLLSFGQDHPKYPIIELGSTSYFSKKWGRTVPTPLFLATGQWVGREDWDVLAAQRRRARPPSALTNQQTMSAEEMMDLVDTSEFERKFEEEFDLPRTQRSKPQAAKPAPQTVLNWDDEVTERDIKGPPRVVRPRPQR
jgi:hypothetical protein